MTQDDTQKQETPDEVSASSTSQVQHQGLEKLEALADVQENYADHDDLNPRSPKRRRISPPKDDDPFDIGAAAARALAMSLGGDLASINIPTNISQVQQNGTHQHTPTKTASPPLGKSIRQDRQDNLPALHDLSSQILLFLARLNHLEIGEMLFGPPSPRGQEYRALKGRFDNAKKIYLTSESPFLFYQALDLYEVEQIDMIRRTNLAIFMASIFSGEIGLRIMDINFIEVFVPEGGRLLKAQGSIYLELKTHAFMAATRTASTMLNQVMMDLFPSDMERSLLQKRPGAKGLAPSEQDFLNRLGSRRDILYSVIRSNKLNTLPDTYRWNDFAREVSIYLTKYMESETTGSKDGLDVSYPMADSAHQQDHINGQNLLRSLTNLEDDVPQASGFSNLTGFSAGPELSFDIQAMVAQAARTAALSMGDGIDLTLLPTTTIAAPPKSPLTTVGSKHAIDLGIADAAAGNSDSATTDKHADVQPHPSHNTGATVDNIDVSTTAHQDPNEIPHSSQTAPTQVLYERARLVNTNKALSLKKPALPTHRRPWTTEEENALMTGLDEVKGPHWSQILAMFGPGGTVNESLKDRNQVQLKDKARNLKLFFLKAGIEVPYYLQAVTGDLKTRAPGQAEKMERERMLGETEKSLQDELHGRTDQTDMDENEHVDDAEHSTNTYQEAENTIQNQIQDTDVTVSPAFDMEAMIAQAAASASRGLGPPTTTQ